MNYNFKIEQAFSGKITATGTGWAVALNMDQVNGLGIDVNSLENFDPVAFKRAYLLEETINAGLPAPQPKRYAFFRDLLEQRVHTVQTPRRVAEINLLKELIAELPQDWLSIENRPAQKFVGRLCTTIGNADTVVFETNAGQQLLLDVPAVPSLRKFIREGEDVERHRRYDMDISTNLVASVKDTTLVDLEWQVPWSEADTAGWRLLDQEKLRCVRVIHDSEHIYEFVQANAYVGAEPKYRYTSVFMSMKRYSPEEITQALRDNGYMGMADYRGTCGGQIEWLRLAEFFVEREARKAENELQRDFTYEEVMQKIKEETGLSLPGAPKQ